MRKINTCTFWLVFVTSEVVLSYATKTSQNPICEKVSPLLLGPLMVLQTEDVPKLHPGTNEFKEWYGPNDDNGGTYVEKGGSSKPHSCQTHWPKVAIIVPYRDRAPQLEAFLFHIHPVLQRQQLDYRIFVIEQSSDEKFNRYAIRCAFNRTCHTNNSRNVLSNILNQYRSKFQGIINECWIRRIKSNRYWVYMLYFS